jgi:hypothetical protein
VHEALPGRLQRRHQSDQRRHGAGQQDGEPRDTAMS